MQRKRDWNKYNALANEHLLVKEAVMVEHTEHDVHCEMSEVPSYGEAEHEIFGPLGVTMLLNIPSACAFCAVMAVKQLLSCQPVRMSRHDIAVSSLGRVLHTAAIAAVCVCRTDGEHCFTEHVQRVLECVVCRYQVLCTFHTDQDFQNGHILLVAE